MTEPQFLKQTEGLALGDIVALTGAKAPDGAALDRRILDVAPVDTAGPADLTFVDQPKYVPQLARTHAAACFVSPRLMSHVPAHVVALQIEAPYRALVAVARTLFPGALRPSSFCGNAGVSPAAHVDPTARLEDAVIVDAGAVIGPDVEIGSGTLIGANAVIGPEVRIGRDCAIGPGTTISNALVGDRVIIHAGARLGLDGFGYLPGPKGHEKVPQVGRVIVQDEVEVGANTTIDRGAMRDTVIGEGTKIDNLVQIAHNVTIGRRCIVVAQTGISGSVVIGDYVLLGGQAGLKDHLTIGDGAQIAAQSGVMEDIPAGTKWGGFPAQPARDWMRSVLVLRRLSRQNSSSEKETGE
ncbi:MAG TPA: UDP-3-O-(3-hydroxymyristoyl)glucosamine N-acyltransferase [Pseudolabrys sp.]|nr:UDP-3-O-(3-hydroxymyristoyl)glucosamine N-acyltransferase [Pseudolabrys sp.]